MHGNNIWSCILKSLDSMHGNIVIPHNVLIKNVGDGTNARFWKDVWVVIKAFKCMFLILFLTR